jgi:predicted dehydrogenase
VQATISNSVLGLNVEDSAAVVFTFAGSTIGEVTTSWTFVAAEQSIEVYGTAGTAILSGVDLASREHVSSPYLQVFKREGETPAWNGSATIPGFVAGQFHHQGPLRFINCVRRGTCNEPGLEEGRASLEMILTAYQAAKSGTTQTFDRGRI